MRKLSSTRLFLGLFVTSILANAVLGIWALLSGDFGETQGKILGTSFLVSAAMLSILINIPASRRRVLWPAPLVGGGAGALGFVLFIALIWAEPDGENWFRLAGSLLVVAAGATLASSLALIDSPGRLRLVHPIVDSLIAVLAVTVIYGLWLEPDTESYARLVGVEGVLVAAATLLVPVLSRFASRREVDRGMVPLAGAPAVRFCPSCGGPVQPQPLGSETATVCDRCGLGFMVGLPVERDALSSVP
ncbi:MAG: hypothetical protein OES24_08645 [Acidimicrobiia bacterium]|nr:hypothetical protein [Acidimicrobiia bacterium]